MGLSIEDAQKALASHPLTIKRSPDEKSLSVFFEHLQNAGAKVLILRPSSSGVTPPALDLGDESDASELKLTDSLDEKPAEPPPKPSVSIESTELEFELELDAKELAPEPEEREAKTFELNLDESADDLLAEIGEELGEKISFESIKAPSEGPKPGFAVDRKPATEKEKGDFSLEIRPAAESMDLIDSQEKQNDIDEKGEWGLETLSSSLKDQSEDSKTNDLGGPLFELEANLEKSEKKKAPANEAIAKSDEKKSGEAPLFDLDVPNNTEIVIAKPDTQNKVQVASTSQTPTPTKSEVITSKEKTDEVESEQKTEQPPLRPIKASPLAKQINVTTIDPDKAAQAKKVKGSGGKKGAKYRTIFGLPADIVLPVLIGGIILGAANWSYFAARHPELSAEIESWFDQSNEPGVPAKPALELPKLNYSTETTTESMQGSIKLTSDFAQFHRVNVQISTKEPAALTPEEIVNNVESRPWLRKIEIDSLQFSKTSDGSLKGKGPAKVYIEQGHDRNRIIANATMLVSPDSDKQNVKVSLEVNLNYTPVEGESPELSVKKIDAANYMVFVKLAAEMKKK